MDAPCCSLAALLSPPPPPSTPPLAAVLSLLSKDWNHIKHTLLPQPFKPFNVWANADLIGGCLRCQRMKGQYSLALNPLMASSLVITTRGCPLPDAAGQTGTKSHLLDLRVNLFALLFIWTQTKLQGSKSFIILFLCTFACFYSSTFGFVFLLCKCLIHHLSPPPNITFSSQKGLTIRITIMTLQFPDFYFYFINQANVCTKNIFLWYSKLNEYAQTAVLQTESNTFPFKNILFFNKVFIYLWIKYNTSGEI